STDIHILRTSTSPSPGWRTLAVATSKSLSFGMPTGRALSRTSLEVRLVMFLLHIRDFGWEEPSDLCRPQEEIFRAYLNNRSGKFEPIRMTASRHPAPQRG